MIAYIIATAMLLVVIGSIAYLVMKDKQAKSKR
jgi:hypothetical protein